MQYTITLSIICKDFVIMAMESFKSFFFSEKFSCKHLKEYLREKLHVLIGKLVCHLEN